MRAIEIANNLREKFSSLQFVEETHSYSVEGKKLKSVTSLVSELCQPFDKEGNAEKYAKKHGLLKEDVIKKWDENSKAASEYGTAVHKYIEDKWNDNILIDASLYLEESDKHRSCKAKCDRLHDQLSSVYTNIANEIRVYDVELGLAGTIDALLYNKEKDEISIFDWKTSKEIKRENKWANMKRLYWLQDCNFNHYSLQLGIYKYIIERNTDYKITNCNIVQISELYDEPKIYEALDLSVYIPRLFQEQKI